MDATISRGGTTVNLPLVASGSGVPLVSVDSGKPSLEIQPSGALQPRHQDQWSGLETYTLLGRFTSSTAYSDVIELVDLIKSNPNGSPLALNIPMGEFDTDIPVVPAAGQDEAIKVAYPPGKKNTAEVDLGLTRVNSSNGGAAQPASTPTATGSGPIQLTDGTNTVDLVKGVTVERAVGRPKDTIRRSTADYPTHIGHHKTAHDAFEISLRFTESTVSKVSTLSTMFSNRLGRASLDLKFNGLYGMGTFNVVPDGSGALRHTRPSGHAETKLIPKISLRRVL